MNNPSRSRLFALPRRIKYPGSNFRFGSIKTRQFYHSLCRLIRHNIYHKRRTLAQELCRESNIRQIPVDKGFMVFAPGTFKIAQDAIFECKKIKQRANTGALNLKPDATVLNLLSQYKLGLSSPIMKFASNPEIVGAVSNYLGMLPILDQINLWYSPNREDKAGSSQMFHLDHADVKQVKVFLFIEDVTEDSGPLTIVPASISENVSQALDYNFSAEKKRVDDDAMYNLAGETNIKPMVGKSGTIAMVDTSRCFHYGSRSANKPRLILMLQYLSPFAFVLPWRWQDRSTFKHLFQNDTPTLIRFLFGAE